MIGDFKMTNKRIKEAIFSSVIFVLSALIIIGAGFYKSTLTKESVSFKFNLLGKDVNPVIFDIAQEGIPKKLAQPGKVSISTGKGAGILNNGKEPVLVQVKAEGFTGDVQINSSDSSFEKQTGKFVKPIKPGEGLNLGIVFDIPYRNINQSLVSRGNIEFTNLQNGKLIAKLPIKVVNSSIKERKK
jgi:hypothetical protein